MKKYLAYRYDGKIRTVLEYKSGHKLVLLPSDMTEENTAYFDIEVFNKVIWKEDLE